MASAIRWRLCADSAGSDGPGRRPPRADHSRCAARERTSNSASSGSSRISNVASVGGSLSHSRCVVPPNRTTACHPSDARRSSAPVSLVRSNSYRQASIDERTPAGSTVGRTSGAQKMACVSKGWRGSAAKRKPPSLSEFFLAQRSRRPATLQRAVIFTIVEIATKTLPGEVSCFGTLQACIGLRRSPIEFRHRITFPMLKRTGNCSTKMGTLYGCTIRCRYCVIQLCNQGTNKKSSFCQMEFTFHLLAGLHAADDDSPGPPSISREQDGCRTHGVHVPAPGRHQCGG
jgi:hypothetical protein